jgi:hypothetical protein
MAFNIRLRDWFFQTTASATKRGSRLKDGDRPSEAIFKDLTDNIIFKSEGDDRAKEDSASTPIAELNGHVVAATDTQAKANEAKKSDRTLVTQPSQLPTVVEDATASSITYKELDGNYVESSTTHNDKLVEVSADATTTRNNFVVNLYSDFITFLQGLTVSFNDIVDKVKAINTRVDNNATAIASLQGSVGGNFDQLLPIGSTTFHLNPAMTADDVWKAANGVTEVDKWVTPGDSGSGEAVIYTMLKDIYTLANGATADLFKLPDLSDHMAYQEFDGADYTLGKTAGEWGGLIATENLPEHNHGGDGLVISGGEHTHTISAIQSALGFDGPYDTRQQTLDASFTGTELPSGITTSGAHSHAITGNTANGGGVSSPNKFIFTPPKLGGGYLIKVA